MKILHVCPLFNVKLSFYWLVLGFTDSNVKSNWN
jgi:hypothetical protein